MNLNQKFIEQMIGDIVKIVELIIAAIIIVGIFIGLIDLVKYFLIILEASPENSYNMFQAFLGHALLLIVGAELILMILYSSTNALLELILFVIARKMLIYSNTVVDLIYGTIAILIIFFTMKYLIPESDENLFHNIRGKKKSETNIVEDKNN